MSSVVLLLAGFVLLIGRLMTRFGDDAPSLNMVDYRAVTDRPGLNRFAGNRVLFLALVCFGMGVAALKAPDVAGWLAAIAVATIFVTLVWIAAQAQEFYVPMGQGERLHQTERKPDSNASE